MPAATAEDEKLITLARSARARHGAAEGAAVRDDIGRTYVAATVALPSLSLSAVQAVVAAAVSSGSASLESIAVVGEPRALDPAEQSLLDEVGISTVIRTAPDGSPHPAG